MQICIYNELIMPLNSQCKLKIVYVCNESKRSLYMYYTFDESNYDFVYRCYRVRTEDLVNKMVLINSEMQHNPNICAILLYVTNATLTI